MARKQRLYGERYPIDEDFLAALALMPPACGCALGFDRLVMLATGASPHRPGDLDAAGAPATPDARGRIHGGNLGDVRPRPRPLTAQHRAIEGGRPAFTAGPPGPPGDGARAVAARYAVAITPGDGRADRPRPIPTTRSRASSSPIRRNSWPGRTSAPIRSATMPSARWRESCTAVPTGCSSSSCTPVRSIAGSASAARWSDRAGAAGPDRAQARAAAYEYIRAHPRNLGSHSDRRRPAGADPAKLACAMQSRARRASSTSRSSASTPASPRWRRSASPRS